jgi:hypothetical protein
VESAPTSSDATLELTFTGASTGAVSTPTSVATNQSGQDEGNSNQEKKPSNTGRNIGIGVGVGVGVAVLLAVVAVVLLRKRRNQDKGETEAKRPDSIEKQDDTKGAGNMCSVAEMQHQEPVCRETDMGSKADFNLGVRAS